MALRTRQRATPRHTLQRLRRTSRLYAVLSHVGEAVFRASGQDELFETVCRIAVEQGAFPLVWIGMADPVTGEVRPVSAAGPAVAYLTEVRITVRPEPEGQGPTGTAIREGRPVVNNDFFATPYTRPWHGAARRFELRASAAFPLVVHGQALGALNLYANRPGFFDVHELALLERVADAVAFALEKLADEEQRRLAEQALRESEARYRRLTEHATDLIYRIRLHPSSAFEYVNPAATALTGYTPEDHYADPELGLKLVHPDDQPLLLRLTQDRALLAEPIELRWIRRDGSLLWVEQRNVPILDATGKLVAIEGIARDITDRKLAEQALREERALLEARVAERTRELQLERDRTRAILESLGEAVMVFDTDGNLTYLNPAAARLTGTNPETLGRWWDQQPGEGKLLLAELHAAARNRRAWQGELPFRRADGALYDAAVTVTPLFAPDDPEQVIGFVSVHRDITALKNAERMKDQFVSNVSHELRSPTSLITMLAGNLEMLYHRLDDARRLEVIGEIRKHTRHLSDLIGGVLEISRIDSDRIATDRQALNMAELVLQEVAHLAPVARRKALRLDADVPERLPVNGHAGQIQQVLRNLLTNAIKYTPDGGRITVTGRDFSGPDSANESGWPGAAGLPEGRWAAIAVTDTGIGIGAEDLPHIFERFYRVRSQSEIPGTGLGLPIAAELVRRHGGVLEVSSTLGQGSTFAVYLPMAEAAS